MMLYLLYWVHCFKQHNFESSLILGDVEMPGIQGNIIPLITSLQATLRAKQTVNTSQQKSSLHSQQSTLQQQQSTLHPQQSTLQQQQSTLQQQQSTLQPQQSTLQPEQISLKQQQSTHQTEQISIKQQQSTHQPERSTSSKQQKPLEHLHQTNPLFQQQIPQNEINPDEKYATADQALQQHHDQQHQHHLHNY